MTKGDTPMIAAASSQPSAKPAPIRRIVSSFIVSSRATASHSAGFRADARRRIRGSRRGFE